MLAADIGWDAVSELPTAAREQVVSIIKPVLPPPDDPLFALTIPTGGTTYPLDSIPELHSRLLGSTASVYLDFDGHDEPVWGAHQNISTPAFDLDGDATSYTQTELAWIQEIWRRVSEHFSPFNTDVTTFDPGTSFFQDSVRIAIGGDGAWYRVVNPDAAGVAILGSFTDPSDVNTVFVFSDLYFSERGLAGAASHEAGHSFGLDHQSLYHPDGTKLDEYHPGLSDRVFIMGNPYGNDRQLWWYGQSSECSTCIQDDLAILSNGANGFGFAPDDHGDSVGFATALTDLGSHLFGFGVIGEPGDVDFFSFVADSARANIEVDVEDAGGMLDARVELYSAAGEYLAGWDPPSHLDASMSNIVTPGSSYRIAVRTADGYGSLGRYRLRVVTGADLDVESFSVSPSELAPGQTFSARFQVANRNAMQTSAFVVKFYLWNQDAFGADRRLLGSYAFSGLAEEYTTGIINKTLTLPDPEDDVWIGNGTYRIEVVVDEDNDIIETDEANNNFDQDVSVLAPLRTAVLDMPTHAQGNDGGADTLEVTRADPESPVEIRVNGLLHYSEGYVGKVVVRGSNDVDHVVIGQGLAGSDIDVRGEGGDDLVDVSYLVDGAITLDGGAGTDTIIDRQAFAVSGDARWEYVLRTDVLQRDYFTASGERYQRGMINLASFENAAVTGRTVDTKFTVSDWLGSGSISAGERQDEVLVVRDADIHFGGGELSISDGGLLALSNVEHLGLTGGLSDNQFTLDAWLGSATLDGSDGTDVLVIVGDEDFGLTGATLTRSASGTIDLASIEAVSITAGEGDNTLTVDGFGGGVTLEGGRGNDLFDLSGTTASATVSGGQGVDTFQMTDWHGTASIDGGAGIDRVESSRAGAQSLEDASLVRSGSGVIGLAGIEEAVLSGAADSDDLQVSNWSGTAVLQGGFGDDTYTVTTVGTGSGSTTIVEETFSGSDSLLVNAPADPAPVYRATQVVQGGETIDFDADLENVTINAAAAVSLGGDQPGMLLDIAATRHVNVVGDAHLSISGLLTISGGSLSAGNLINDGDVWLENDASRIVGQMLTNNNLIVVERGSVAPNELVNQGEVQLLGDWSSIGGDILSNSGLLLGTGQITASLQNAVPGELRVDAGQRLTLAGIAADNLGAVYLDGGTLEVSQPLTNGPTGFIAGHGTLRALGGLDNRGVLPFSAGDTHLWGDVTNGDAGWIVVTGGGQLFVNGPMNHHGAGIVTSIGSTAIFSGDVSGSGGFTGVGTSVFEANLAPGTGTAAISFAGDVAFQSMAQVEIELAGLARGSQFDAIDI
ncbi:MAG: CARDB domain-containing protein, partial [Pirellulales bacterium]